MSVVIKVERHQKNQFRSVAVYGPIDHAGLRLVTCGSDFDNETGHYERQHRRLRHPADGPRRMTTTRIGYRCVPCRSRCEQKPGRWRRGRHGSRSPAAPTGNATLHQRVKQWRGLTMRTDNLAVHYWAALTLAGSCSGPSHDPSDAS